MKHESKSVKLQLLEHLKEIENIIDMWYSNDGETYTTISEESLEDMYGIIDRTEQKIQEVRN